MLQIDRPNIIKIYEYYIDSLDFYLITEFVSGGELYNTIINKKIFSEENTIYVMKQLLSAVYYLHSKRIVHRDIKPENILVESRFDKNKIRKDNNTSIQVDINKNRKMCNLISDNTLFDIDDS